MGEGERGPYVVYDSLRLNWRHCPRWPDKRQYWNPADAADAAVAFGGDKEPYRCPYCRLWHIGSPAGGRESGDAAGV